MITSLKIVYIAPDSPESAFCLLVVSLDDVMICIVTQELIQDIIKYLKARTVDVVSRFQVVDYRQILLYWVCVLPAC